MALHGIIRVNAHEIGYWDVQRLDEVADRDEVHRYRYEVFVTSWRAPVVGVVEHRYADGAPALLGKVFTDAAQHGEFLPEEPRLPGPTQR